MLKISLKATSREPVIQSAMVMPAMFRAWPPATPLTETGGVKILGSAPLRAR